MHRKTSEPSFIDTLITDHVARIDQLDRIDQTTRTVNELLDIYNSA